MGGMWISGRFLYILCTWFWCTIQRHFPLMLFKLSPSLRMCRLFLTCPNLTLYFQVWPHSTVVPTLCCGSAVCVCVCVCVCTRRCACTRVHVLSCVWLFATPWAIACQAPLPTEFSRQEYWSGLPFPSPGDLQTQGSEPGSLMSPALAGRFFTTSTTWQAPCVALVLFIFIARYRIIAIRMVPSMVPL